MSSWLSKKEGEFYSALQARDIKKMRALFNKVPTVDLAEFADQVEDPSSLTFIFKVVPSELTADFFTELDDDTQEALLRTFTDAQLVELINKSYTDDIVDFLEDMPANLVTRALKFVPKERREAVNKLLNYQEDTAASIMTTEYFEFHADVTVSEAMKVIREKGKTKETIYTVFIRDDKRTLVGTVDLDDLIFAKPDQTLDEIKNKEFLFTRADTDQEEVAAKFKKYDLHALAVVNKEQKLVGVITFDDIMDVIEEEASEDIALQSGVVPLQDEYMQTKPLRMALKCVPWLIALIIIGVFSELVLSKFQEGLSVVPALVFFIPVLMDTGGNAGGQTCGLIIRALALREFEVKDFWKVVWKEIKTALLIGVFVGIMAFGVFMIEFSIPGLIEVAGKVLTIQNKLIISTIVALSLFSAIVISKFVACALPFLAVKLKKDPALTSQPFVTTIVDVCSLLIYFGIFMIFYSNGFFINLLN